MGLFDRFRRQPESGSDYKALSALGDNQNAWAGLDAEQLKQVVMVKCIEYGTTQDGSRIPRLFALYRYAQERLAVPERLRLLADFSTLTEQQKGLGHMGLMMFMAGDDAPAVVSSAALSLCVLYDPDGNDPLAGPRFVISTLAQREDDPTSLGAGLGGVLLLGDRRILPLVAEAWDDIPEDAQLEMTKAKSGLVAEAIVEFWLDRLEEGCSESVFGSAVAAIAKTPAISQVPFVVDLKRTLPAYSGTEPVRILRRTSPADYLEKIRPRLDALLETESEPKVIPEIYKIWKNPDAYRGIIG
jgi:hypothetical protein